MPGEDDKNSDPGHAPPKLPSERFRLLVESVIDYAIFMLDPEGRVMTWNVGAQRLKQYQAHEIIGRSFEVFYPPEALAARWPREELRLAAEQGRFEEEGWRVRKDGTTFWANVVITALRGPEGHLEGYAKVTRDLTERRRQDENLRRSEEQTRLLLESVKDYAIFMLDGAGKVLTWNAGAQAIKGYAASEVIGHHFSMFFTPQDVAAGKPQDELASALATGRAESEGWRVRKDGSLFWANAVITPVYDEHGQLRGFAKITRDLSEQQRLGELEQSSRRMQEFIAMLAHELRNPLAPIRNAATILQADGTLPSSARHIVDIVGRQLGTLTRLVDDLLDVGRVATGKIALKLDDLEYRSVVELSVEAARPSIDERAHRLVLDVFPGPIPIRGDATRLAQALQNLLQNASRYTPAGGEIRLAVALEGAFVVTTVRDTGVGIAPEAQERIFDLFTQERVIGPQSEPGLGIGLALARTLIELQGGRLSVYSEGIGKGSTFTMRLAVRDGSEGARDAPAALVTGERMPALRILVVDDNADSADTMAALLQMLGHDARAAYGGAHALAVAKEFEPGAALLDLNMPGDDGYAVMKQLRAQAARPIYIAAMTGYGEARDRERTLASGFQAHLTKPVDPRELQRVLAEAARHVGR